jgi:hypothetical protein
VDRSSKEGKKVGGVRKWGEEGKGGGEGGQEEVLVPSSMDLTSLQSILDRI